MTDRVPVRKTYKLYVNGAFVRSERGRYLRQMTDDDNLYANYAWASRKDLRDAITAARKAQASWAARSAFNRSLILYRAAEMLETRKPAFRDHLRTVLGYDSDTAGLEVDRAVDLMVYYSGWADKFSQITSSVNPVAAPFFNFSFPEPTGIVVSFAATRSPLVGLVAAIFPVVLSGNTAVVVVEGPDPTLAIELAEVFATSDWPAGVVNVLTGKREELSSHAAGHMDVNSIAVYGGDFDARAEIQRLGSENVKRVRLFDDPEDEWWRTQYKPSMYEITPFVETKTAWHPVGV